jgi:hypothetical protein
MLTPPVIDRRIQAIHVSRICTGWNASWRSAPTERDLSTDHGSFVSKLTASGNELYAFLKRAFQAVLLDRFRRTGWQTGPHANPDWQLKNLSHEAPCRAPADLQRILCVRC